MGFQDYQVKLEPKQNSPFLHDCSLADAHGLASDITDNWPEVTSDAKARSFLNNSIPLVYQGSKELFQILISVNAAYNDAIWVSLRFAYCNPLSISQTFCDFVAWLMTTWGFRCHVFRELAPPRNNLRYIYVVEDADDICEILLPSITYNRERWQGFAGSFEAPIRPTEVFDMLKRMNDNS